MNPLNDLLTLIRSLIPKEAALPPPETATADRPAPPFPPASTPSAPPAPAVEVALSDAAEPSDPIAFSIPHAPEPIEEHPSSADTSTSLPGNKKPARTAPPRRQQRPRIIVGCDFGTHSTKVLFQRRGERNRFRLAEIDSPCDGYPCCATPSICSVDGDRLYFGRQALLRPSAARHASLKVDLLRSEADASPSLPAPADVLVAAYLAWVFTRVQAIVSGEYPDADLTIQIAAPIDYQGYVSQNAIRSRFQRVAQAAWRAAFAPPTDGNPAIVQGSALRPMVEMMRRFLAEPLLPDSDSPVQVLPETVAPIVSLQQLPAALPGIHMMVDTGAGTTEFSVVNSTELRNEPIATCFFDKTIEVGGDLLGRADRNSDGSLNDLITKLEREACFVHATGYAKVASNPVTRRQWSSLTVVLAGGGTKRPEVADIFRDPDRPFQKHYLAQNGIEAKVLDGPPIDLDTRSLGIPEDEARYLVVARGLLVERIHWPTTYLPDEVGPVDP